MTNDHTSFQATEKNQSSSFGARLKAAREALGFESKDVAAQLRLNEKVILMMEKEKYPTDLPVTFIRGYIRAYGKLLQIPEHEVKTALENIAHKPNHTPPLILTPMAIEESVSSGNYFMQFFTYLIVITLIALVGMWWYNHSPAPQTESRLTAIAEPQPLQNNDSTNELAPQPPLATNTITPQAIAPATAMTQENPLDTEKKIKEDRKPTTVASTRSKKNIARREVPVVDANDEAPHETHSDHAD